MATLATPTVRLRRLGNELKRIREDAGLSLDAAGIRLGRSASSLSKIENGRVVLPRRDLTFILDRYAVTDEPLREMLYALARNGRKKGWWRQYGDALSPPGMDLMSLEDDAAVISTFQAIVIPGLLQTEDYAHALMESAVRVVPRDVDRLLRVRMARQQILARERPPRLRAVMGEAVLRQLVGGRAIMRAQLRYLAEMSQDIHVALRVLPFEAGAHVSTQGSFMILGFSPPTDFSVVHLESLEGSLWVEEDESVRRYGLAFDQLRASALSEIESRHLIERVAADL
ncbi:MAG TPA: helix-turn-helix transcriptional regulator [Streptosporangiaceae bacterium]